MNREKRWRIGLGLIAIIYVLAVVYLLFFIFNLNANLRHEQDSYENEIKMEVNNILNSNNNLNEQLAKLFENKRIELVVLDKDNKRVFSSLGFDSLAELENEINKNVISNKALYHVKTVDNIYQVFLATYFLDTQLYFNNFIFIVCSVSVFFSTLLFIVVFLLYRNMVNPLALFANNIHKLRNFDFSNIHTDDHINEYNKLSSEIMEFADDINNSVKDIELRYLKAENKIIDSERQTNIKNSMIRSLIHDLKTPIAIAQMDIYNANVSDKNLKDASNILEELPEKINEILKVLHLDEIPMEKANVDLVVLLNEIIKEHSPLLNDDIYFEFITVDSLVLETYPEIIKQVVGNALTNAIKYLSDGNEIIIELHKNDALKCANLRIVNSSKEISQNDLDNSFGLLTRLNSNSEGSGSGLFIIKSLTEYLNGKVSLKYEEGMIVLDICIPIEVLDN